MVPRHRRPIGRALASVAVLLSASTLGGGSARAEERSAQASLRGGVYTDTDKTTVVRAVAAAQKTFGPATLALDEAIDVVTSASVDVRTSPTLDVLSSASARSPRMRDRRFQTTATVTLDGGGGRTLAASGSFAVERDYFSAGGGLRGTLDFFERNTTLFAGANASHDVVSSMLDPTFERTSDGIGYAAGVAQVLGRRVAGRVRYDGSARFGYMASPYRHVRFGNYTMTQTPEGAVTFSGTIGPTAGLPEHVPDTRIRHAATAEIVAELFPRLSALVNYRFAIDSWSVLSYTGSGELRWLACDACVMRLSYRYYHQIGAEFWRGRYRLDPNAYSYFTADKELGDMRSHDVGAGPSFEFRRDEPTGVAGKLDATVHAIRFDYPGFALLDGKTALVIDVGAALEF